MRTPGFRAVAADALDEAAEQFTSCPICEGYLQNDMKVHWDPRLVRTRWCPSHGYFLIRWFAATKKIHVEWIFDHYLEDHV